MTRMFRRLFLALLACATAAATAQDASFSIGFDGEVTAGRWNPFEFSFRDQSAVTLTLTIDQGDLRSGQIPMVATFTMPGGAGLTVLEDDLFIPPWQSFSWSAATEQRVIASGSFHPRDMDARPLAVILSTAAVRHAGLVPDGLRSVALPGARLPERLAAWDAVALLIIDGTTAPPTPGAVLAAAAAGASVLLLDPLPASYAGLELLTGPEPVTRIGAGRLLRDPQLLDLEPEFDSGAVERHLASLVSPDPVRPIRLVLLAPLLLVAAVGAAVLLRFAGLAGAAAASGVMLLAVFLAWPVLRPEPVVSSGELELHVSAGGLSRAVTFTSVLDRTGGVVSLAGNWRPPAPLRLERTGTGTSATAARWQPLVLLRQPRLAEAGSGSTVSDPLQQLFPAGSQVAVSAGRIEVFLDGVAP